MKSPVIIAVIIALLSGGWVISAVLFPPQKASSVTEETLPQDAPLMNVRVRRSTALPVTDYAVITGRTQAHRSVSLASEISARVEELKVEEGTSVKEGDILAILATDDRAARVEEARRRVNQRRIQYNAAQSLQKKGFNSEIRLAEALAELEASKAELELAQKNFNNIKITAPFDGIVNNQMIEVGDFVREGDIAFSIVDLDPIEMVGFVSERNIIHIENGIDVSSTFLNGETVTGKLTFIAPAADNDTRTFRVKAEMANPDLKIKDGLTAEMKIPLADIKAHKVPSSNLTLNDDGSLGLKILDMQNKVIFKPVRVISSQNGIVSLGGLPNEITYISVGAEFVGVGEIVNPDFENTRVDNSEDKLKDNSADNLGVSVP